MGLNFRMRDFAYPFAIMRKKRHFDRHQYFSSEALEAYQISRLRKIILQAGANIPYYKKLFSLNDINPSSIAGLSDLTRIPFLAKDALMRSFSDLTAVNAALYDPMELHTSGTTGGQVKFLVDKPSNILEFVYYWRFWGWHGYRIGNKFAEFSAQHFTPIEKNSDKFYEFNPIVNRLIVNSLLLSKGNVQKYIALFKKNKPLFLKGLPSNLYVFALLCNEIKNHGIAFRAIFSQGENLFQNQKRFIETVFSSPVFDSYGQLERIAAISQCPYGAYHIHSDYSIVELVKPRDDLLTSATVKPGQSLFEVVGTSLHNLSMPLIRYKTGDLVITDASQEKCPCNRCFPRIRSIIGRDSDIVITPNKRAITALYVALDRLPGIACGQIVQESPTTLIVKIVPTGNYGDKLNDSITERISAFTGNSMNIIIENRTLDELYAPPGKKFKSIVSHVDPLTILN
jgi:phenylacetate-CoA ligase